MDQLPRRRGICDLLPQVQTAYASSAARRREAGFPDPASLTVCPCMTGFPYPVVRPALIPDGFLHVAVLSGGGGGQVLSFLVISAQMMRAISAWSRASTKPPTYHRHALRPVVHAGDIQDRDGAVAVLKSILHACPWLRHLFADGAYAGPKLRGALDRIGKWTLDIVKRSDTVGFEVLPRRWVVERAFAWLGRCRRLAKDWEKTIASSQAWIDIAHIRITTRRLARHCRH